MRHIEVYVKPHCRPCAATQRWLAIHQVKHMVRSAESYADFLRELAKAKVSLSLSQKAEWETYFTTEQQNAQNLKQQIAATDSEIDCMVYELYGLTDEEIRIVEGE